MLLCLTAVFSLYSQNTAADANSTAATSLTEESIVLADDAATDNQNTTSYKGPSTIGMFVRMIIVLIIVVGLIYGVLWFIKKKDECCEN